MKLAETEAELASESAKRADAESALQRLREQVKVLRTSVESEMEAAVRESAHREAVAEKQALAAQMEVNSLTEALAAAGQKTKEKVRELSLAHVAGAYVPWGCVCQAVELKEQAIRLKLAERRATSLQHVFQTVMEAKDDEKTAKIEALEAQAKVNDDERQRLRAQAQARAKDLAALSVRMTQLQSALNSANARAARQSRALAASAAIRGHEGGSADASVPSSEDATQQPTPREGNGGRRPPSVWSRPHQAMAESASMEASIAGGAETSPRGHGSSPASPGPPPETPSKRGGKKRDHHKHTPKNSRRRSAAPSASPGSSTPKKGMTRSASARAANNSKQRYARGRCVAAAPRADGAGIRTLRRQGELHT